MKKTDTERKLALVQTIRMENQYNRMKCRERESILYGNGFHQDKGELYGAEMTAAMPGYMEENPPIRKGSLFGGWRLRFLLAAALVAAFIYMDLNHLDLYGRTTDDLLSLLKETTELNLPNSFDF
jgi:ATPase components of ABC transporters with duplicated ATPase domains